jgi:hypothetical protein
MQDIEKESEMNAITTLEVSALQLSSVDVLGSLLAQIDELNAEVKKIKDEIKDQLSLVDLDEKGNQRLDLDGALFSAVATACQRRDTDTKKLYAAYGITDEVLENYKKKAIAVYTVKVTAR